MASERLNSAQLLAARTAQRLVFKHDPQLPISAQREAIMDALRADQVLIVAGDTGSGKSTQLPQYCLELGRGIAGLIAHTQPRRLAARALSARIAEELSQSVGSAVGYRVRFADRVSPATRLQLMTDGLLLSELSSDPLLQRYDTIIVDEAHERSLNVDLLLGVLKRLLPRRPELKLIITSATLDIERVSAFFGGARIVSVGGRSHPVEVRYAHGAQMEEDPDLPTAVLAACQEIGTQPGEIGRGDILVFLPGEREIRDVGEVLERELSHDLEILPLYSRLSWEQQNKIFQRGGRQRVVLATNVAETSVTVPGIRSVVDSGLARISRYSLRNRLQRLPIEPVSRASADQRKGRCGRLGPGLCIRLYTEEDFQRRPPFTEPEVLRTNLAALLLRLAAEGLGAAEQFPFIDAPDTRSLNDGYRLLQELQALDAQRLITRHGRAMARLPLDPRLGRSLLESQKLHAQAELLIIAAGLSVPDVRIGAAGEEGEDAASFQDPKSDFSSMIKLWRTYVKLRAGPRRELRRWCTARRFSLLRLSEWDDVYSQLKQRAAELGIVAQPKAAGYSAIHRALLSGFCTMAGVRSDDGGYAGVRSVRFHIFPGSALARRKPRWVMAAHLVETSRVFARHVAEIEPAWVESAAAHLLKREYLEPDYDEAREEVVARLRTSLFGLVLRENKLVNYGPIAPEESRRIFAREALVFQRLTRRPDWVLINDDAIHAAQRIEERLRTRGLLHDAESFVAFYDGRLPRQVSSGATLEYFSRHLSQADRQALRMRDEDLFARRPDPKVLAGYPEAALVGSLSLSLHYRFAPGEPADGATLQVPLLGLPGLTTPQVHAAVPGLTAPRIEALLRSLPKEARRSLIPIPETVAAFLAAEGGGAADAARLAAWLAQRRGVPAAQLRFDPAGLSSHLWVRLSVTQHGREIDAGTQLAPLRRRCADAMRAELTHHAHTRFDEGAGWERFELDELPDTITIPIEEGQVNLFPTLELQDGILKVALVLTTEEAELAWRDAAPRLARLLLAPQARDLARSILASAVLVLGASAYMDGEALSDTVLQMVFRRVCFGDVPAPRSRDAFERAVEQARPRLALETAQVCEQATAWFAEAAAVRRALDAPSRGMAEAQHESRGHLARLLDARSIASAGAEWLRQLPRYLKAERQRWQRNGTRGHEPAQILSELRVWSVRWRQLEQQIAAEHRRSQSLEELRFWIEEYRVSLYAQTLKTVGPVSAARLEQRAAALQAWLDR